MTAFGRGNHWGRRTTRQGEVKTELDGHSFSSKLEASVYQQLKLRQHAGEITDIQVQATVRICGPQGHPCKHTDKIDYIPDFKCTRPDGSTFFVEAKGFETPHWKLKLRLWKHNGPGDLELWKGSHVRPVLTETVKGAA